MSAFRPSHRPPGTPRALVCSALVALGSAGCRGTEAEPPARPAVEVIAPSPAIADVELEPPAPEPQPARGAFCDRRVRPLEDAQGEPRRLGELLRTTPLVAVVSPELSEVDCSGIGHHHVSYLPVSPDDGPLIRAYRSLQLPAFLPARATHYVLGGAIVPERTVSLQNVCIPFAEPVNATVDWLLPIDDPKAIGEELRACGWRPPGCRGCSADCGDQPGCCRLYEDSCPGPDGAFSTCAGFLPCDASCCAPPER